MSPEGTRNSWAGSDARPLLWALAALLCAACQPAAPIEPFPVVYVSENIRFAPDPALPICGKSLDYIDQFIDAYERRSGYGEMKEPIRYNYISSELARELCDNRACAGNGRVYSPYLVHPHELVHGVRQQQGLPISLIFLEEGIAQAHDAFSMATWPDSFELTDMLEYPNDSLPLEHYNQAGHLISYIRHQYSWASAEEFVVAATDVDSVADLDDAVSDTLGIDLDRLNTNYLASYPRCPGIGWTEFIVECSATPKPWSEDSTGRRVFNVDEHLSCGHPDAFGPVGQQTWLTYTVDIPAAGSYHLDVPELPGMILEIGACDTGCDLADGFTSRNAAVDRTLWLNAGYHVVRIGRPLNNPGPVAMRLEEPLK